LAGKTSIDGTIGVRYARNCHPDDLWTKYFTSSKVVQEYREKFGEPDVVEIRKTFLSQIDAREWEHKVLRRLKVIENERWLNKSNGRAIPPQFGRQHSEDFKERQRRRMLKNNPMVGRVQSEREKEIRQEIRKKPKSEKAKENIRNGKIGDKNPNYGRKHDSEYCKRMSEKLKGRVFSEEHRQNLKGKKNRVECSYCHKLFSPHIISRYHGIKCQENRG
jgi:hypothetical protein